VVVALITVALPAALTFGTSREETSPRGFFFIGGRMARSTGGAERRSTSAERQIQVRQVTHVQASWTEQDRGEAGAFTLQLILDNGAAEYVLRPTAEDADVLVKLFARSASATFDVDRKVLMFGNLAVK
jgi:hypothetical protein